MIINNEKDRMKFIRELLSAELPCKVKLKSKKTKYTEHPMDPKVLFPPDKYPRNEDDKLGEHPSGMQESKEL